MDHISISKLFNGRQFLGVCALCLTLSASGIQASVSSVPDDAILDDDRIGERSSARLSQKRLRAEISGGSVVSEESSLSASSSSSSSSSGSSLDSAESEDERNVRRTLRVAGSHSYGSTQIYATPTNDCTFKHLLSHENMLQAILETFVPDENIRVVRLLDAHLRPFAEYEKARSFLNSKRTVAVTDKLSALLEYKSVKDNKFNLSFVNTVTDEENSVHGGSEFIKGLAEIYDDILCGYPLPERNSQVDVLCKMENGGYVIVEMQVAEKSYWDKRALAYAANLYGRQLRKSHQWDDIKKVICINILGGGVKKCAWKTRTRFRKITFKDQFNDTIKDGIEIFQYPLYHESLQEEAGKRKTVKDRTAFLEWIEFFEHADNKKESDMSSIKTDEVRQAYELIKTENLPKYVLDRNREQNNELSQYGERMKIERDEGKVEGKAEEKIEIAKKLMARGDNDEEIHYLTSLSLEQIAVIRSDLVSLS
ncbi:MAG: Rpn family recombination-promoting nuclease/putative transposase [Alphaproteobacteria bacterium]|nr:Rpn family recombination-promoting nuclease/putative transposase [Alphaproteobacteria bacterium]